VAILGVRALPDTREAAHAPPEGEKRPRRVPVALAVRVELEASVAETSALLEEMASLEGGILSSAQEATSSELGEQERVARHRSQTVILRW